MDQVRQVLRARHYARRTEASYCLWIRRYIFFFDAQRHPRDMGAPEVEAFLGALVVEERLSAATQRQALNALVFLYREVFDQPLPQGLCLLRSRKRPRLPTVLSRSELRAMFAQLDGVQLLMAKMLYGSGLRLMECLRLRLKDLDLDRKRLRVHGKGGKWRGTVIASPLVPQLVTHVDRVRRLHARDLREGFGAVALPSGLERKLPRASTEPGWQFLFPSRRRSVDPRGGGVRRHHVDASGLQKAVKLAAQRAEIDKRVSCHTFRHSFATAMLEGGTNLRLLQELMGHADVKTTERYLHVMDKDIARVQSPLEELGS